MSTDVGDAAGFGLHNLPYGVFATDRLGPRVGVAFGSRVLDLAGALADPVFESTSLNPFLARGPAAWAATRARVQDLLAGLPEDPAEPHPAWAHLHPLSAVRLGLPVRVGDYVDFYSSLEHASNVGLLLRPDAKPLPANWRHLPAAYHGRAGTVVVSGTPVTRPAGQLRPRGADRPSFGPSRRLDVEVEVGFVVGVASRQGQPLSTSDFSDHVFGVVLVNDWSARDIQAWEYVPLGPFVAKSFATSISPWVVPLAALQAARVRPPEQDPLPLPYLSCPEPWGLDLRLQLAVNGNVVSRPPFAGMYWTAPQQLAHLTVGGAAVRTGDLFASGTVSGPAPDQRGSLLELSWGGAEPLTLPDGTQRTFLEDGDEVTISGAAPGPAGEPIGLGAVTGRVRPTPSPP